MEIIVTAMEKQGPVIICTTNDPKNRTYKVDFKKGKMYGISGRPIQSADTIISRATPDLRGTHLYAGLKAFSQSYPGTFSKAYYSVVESLLSYPDLLPPSITTSTVEYIINNCDGKLPKGYIAWCRENNFQISYVSIAEFRVQQKLSTWPQDLRETVQKFKEGAGCDLFTMTNYDKELCASLMRIVNNSLKRYEICGLTNRIHQIFSMIYNWPNLRPYLDETKSAKVALKILDDAKNKERNDKILATEAQIAQLNGMVFGDLMVKVPSAMSDFNDEGEQQHNCVGYHYHCSMAEGRSIIYFLRKIDDPNKSFVTCRYDPRENRTVEHRLKYNEWFEDNGTVFNKLDEMIKAILTLR